MKHEITISQNIDSVVLKIVIELLLSRLKKTAKRRVMFAFVSVLAHHRCIDLRLLFHGIKEHGEKVFYFVLAGKGFFADGFILDKVRDYRINEDHDRFIFNAF